MFDFGWGEILVVAIVLIIVVGPKDLPRMLRTFGRTMSKLRSMAGEFRTQFDEALKEAELDDVRKTIGDAKKLNPTRDLREAMNPLRKAGQEIRADLDRTMKDKSESDRTVAKEDPAAPVPSTSTSSRAAGNGVVTAGAAKDAATPAKPATASQSVAVTNGGGVAHSATGEAKPAKPKRKGAAKASAAKPKAARAVVSKSTATKTPATKAAPRKTAAAKKTGDA